MSARDAILEKLRRGAWEAALPAEYGSAPIGSRPSGAPATSASAHEPPAAPEGLTARFAERAAAVGTDVRLVTRAELAAAVVAAVVETPGAVVVWDDPLLEPCAQALRAAGIPVISGETETDAAVAGAAFGLTMVDHAIAETGTLVQGSAPGRSRGASLLPARHLAVLPAARICADLFALMRVVRRPLPSALTFITGPSRTADIGLTPVRPAHGPVSVTVFIVSDVRLELPTSPPNLVP